MKLNQGQKHIVWLSLFALATIVLWQLPGGRMILYPFTILGTWFHEMAHGLMAMILGGTFHNLEIFSNGSGLARHSGMLIFGDIGRAMVAAAGPVGPTFAGSIFMAMSRKRTSTKFALFLLGAMLILSVIIWVRSLFGALVILAFGFMIILILLKGRSSLKTLTLQFLAVQAFVSVYLSIDYLFSSGGVIGSESFMSDTAVIEQNIFMPYWFWGGLIIIFSVVMFVSSVRFVYSGK